MVSPYTQLQIVAIGLFNSTTSLHEAATFQHRHKTLWPNKPSFYSIAEHQHCEAWWPSSFDLWPLDPAKARQSRFLRRQWEQHVAVYASRDETSPGPHYGLWRTVYGHLGDKPTERQTTDRQSNWATANWATHFWSTVQQHWKGD